jgi:hypothetical protein
MSFLLKKRDKVPLFYRNLQLHRRRQAVAAATVQNPDRPRAKISRQLPPRRSTAAGVFRRFGQFTAARDRRNRLALPDDVGGRDKAVALLTPAGRTPGKIVRRARSGV